MNKHKIFFKRLERLKETAAYNGKNLIIFNEKNIYYLTGFYGKDASSILLITDDKT